MAVSEGTLGAESGSAEVSEAGGRGWITTLISAVALVFSGISFYFSVMQQADLEVFVPPVLQYGRDGGGDTEVLAVPITIVNEGANTGTVLAMELTVENAAPDAAVKSRVFYSAFVGEHPRDANAPNRSFAPISVPGRATYSETIRFYPQGSSVPRLITAVGEYKFTLSLIVAKPAEPSLLDRVIAVRAPAPLTFTRTLPFMSEQHLAFRRGTISMYAKDWKPAVSSTAAE
jgi:hypothetical protein